MRDFGIGKRPAQFEQRTSIVDQHPIRALRQSQLERTRETRLRVKPRRRVQRGGVSGPPLGLRGVDTRRQQRPLAALRLAPDLDDDARALMRRVAADRQKSGPLLADIDQRRVETGGEAHDPAEMEAAGRDEYRRARHAIRPELRLRPKRRATRRGRKRSAARAAPDDIAAAGQQLRGFMERQADDIRIRARDPRHERGGAALDCVAAGLAAPLAAREIGVQLGRAEALELHLADHPADRDIAGRRHQRDAAIDPVTPARQQFEAGAGGRLVLGFRQDAAPAGDDRIGGENKGAGVPRRDGPRLGLGQPHDMRRRQLAALRGFVDIGRVDPIRHDADLA